MLRFPVFTVPTDSPIPAMVLLGTSYAVFTAAIWPSLYLEVNEEHRASAFAFASAGKNVSHIPYAWPHLRALISPMLSTMSLQVALAGTPLLIGYVRNISPNYNNVESLLLGGSTTTLFLCLMLGCINSNRRGSRGHLNAPTFATIQSPSSVAVRMRC
jgi:hypothetical protein